MKYIKQIFLYLSFLSLVGVMISCEKNIDRGIVSRERSLLEFKLQGQLGAAVIKRDDDEASATIYILVRADYPYSAATVEGIVVSDGATPGVTVGQTLNFSNPERKAKVTVTAPSGEKLDWWIYLKTYDPFYVGTWKIDGLHIHCDQVWGNAGGGVWNTPLNGSEFGNETAEYDNRIIITLDEETGDNELTGTITNAAGADGKWSDFHVVIGPYLPPAKPLDMNPRLRYCLPPEESIWSLDLTTGKMSISQKNVTSTMTFEQTGEGSCIFHFPLPDARSQPWTDNEFSNFWRCSTELFYTVTKISK